MSIVFWRFLIALFFGVLAAIDTTVLIMASTGKIETLSQQVGVLLGLGSLALAIVIGALAMVQDNRDSQSKDLFKIE